MLFVCFCLVVLRQASPLDFKSDWATTFSKPKICFKPPLTDLISAEKQELINRFGQFRIVMPPCALIAALF